MTDSAIEARRAYARAWNKKNPDKCREYRKRYWEKKARELELAEKAAEQAAEQKSNSE